MKRRTESERIFLAKAQRRKESEKPSRVIRISLRPCAFAPFRETLRRCARKSTKVKRRLDDVPAQLPELKRFDPLDREHHCDLTAVMDVMRHDSPNRPLTRDPVVSSTKAMPVRFSQVRDRPLGQRRPHRFPGKREP